MAGQVRTRPAAASPPKTAGFSFWGSSSASRTKVQREVEEERRRRALLGLPVDDEPEISSLTPLHLKSPPPDPWSIKLSHLSQGVSADS